MKKIKELFFVYFLLTSIYLLINLISYELNRTFNDNLLVDIKYWLIAWFYLSLFLLFIVICIRGFLNLLNPLTDKQLLTIAVNRRNKRINQYYHFTNYYTPFTLDFKKNLNPKGTFYPISIKLIELPFYVANLLKYKKHEWIVIAFEKDQMIDLIWVNKGSDNRSVHFLIETEDLLETSLENDSSTVLFFHNHPNSYSKNISLSAPSETDLNSAKYFANLFLENKKNLLEFICDRGIPNLYWKTIHDDFFPTNDFFLNIKENENNISKSKNLKLNLERIFG